MKNQFSINTTTIDYKLEERRANQNEYPAVGRYAYNFMHGLSLDEATAEMVIVDLVWAARFGEPREMLEALEMVARYRKEDSYFVEMANRFIRQELADYLPHRQFYERDHERNIVFNDTKFLTWVMLERQVDGFRTSRIYDRDLYRFLISSLASGIIADQNRQACARVVGKLNRLLTADSTT